MNLEKRTSIGLYEIIEKIKSGQQVEALADLENLRTLFGQLGKNKEALSVAYCHSEKTIAEAKKQNQLIEATENPLTFDLSELKWA